MKCLKITKITVQKGAISSLVRGVVTGFSIDVNGNLTKFGSTSYYEAVVLTSGGFSGGISSSIA